MSGLINSELRNKFSINHLKTGRYSSEERIFESTKRVICSNLKLYRQIKNEGTRLVHKKWSTPGHGVMDEKYLCNKTRQQQ